MTYQCTDKVANAIQAVRAQMSRDQYDRELQTLRDDANVVEQPSFHHMEETDDEPA